MIAPHELAPDDTDRLIAAIALEWEDISRTPNICDYTRYSSLVIRHSSRCSVDVVARAALYQLVLRLNPGENTTDYCRATLSSSGIPNLSYLLPKDAPAARTYSKFGVQLLELDSQSPARTRHHIWTHAVRDMLCNEEDLLEYELRLLSTHLSFPRTVLSSMVDLLEEHRLMDPAWISEKIHWRTRLGSGLGNLQLLEELETHIVYSHRRAAFSRVPHRQGMGQLRDLILVFEQSLLNNMFTKDTNRISWRCRVYCAPSPVVLSELLKDLWTLHLLPCHLGVFWEAYSTAWIMSIASCTTPTQVGVLLLDLNEITELQHIELWNSSTGKRWTDRLSKFITRDSPGRLATIRSRLLLTSSLTLGSAMMSSWQVGFVDFIHRACCAVTGGELGSLFMQFASNHKSSSMDDFTCQQSVRSIAYQIQLLCGVYYCKEFTDAWKTGQRLRTLSLMRLVCKEPVDEEIVTALKRSIIVLAESLNIGQAFVKDFPYLSWVYGCAEQSDTVRLGYYVIGLVGSLSPGLVEILPDSQMDCSSLCSTLLHISCRCSHIMPDWNKYKPSWEMLLRFNSPTEDLGFDSLTSLRFMIAGYFSITIPDDLYSAPFSNPGYRMHFIASAPPTIPSLINAISSVYFNIDKASFDPEYYTRNISSSVTQAMTRVSTVWDIISVLRTIDMYLLHPNLEKPRGEVYASNRSSFHYLWKQFESSSTTTTLGILRQLYGLSEEEFGHATTGHLCLKAEDMYEAQLVGSNLLFGELLVNGVCKALDILHMDVSTASSLCDLGMGLGKLVIQCYLQYPNLKYVLGVELARSRYSIGEKAVLHLTSLYTCRYVVIIHTTDRIAIQEHDTGRVLELRKQDLFDVGMDQGHGVDADVVITETHFETAMIPKLHAYLNSCMTNGARLLTYERIHSTEYNQLPVNISVEDRFPTTWSNIKGHHFYLYIFNR